MTRLKHISGVTGTYLREIPSRQFFPWTTWVIKTDDGHEYFAPKSEFSIIQ
ncbi:hypothetical protein [Chryseobacterium sp. HR92]|uniref:hypothetical protein n=1 Tax=Chryseobacterium sp. HR92 TaxID=3094839 RepID=UPI00388FBBB4|nr:hypothetical protein SFA27_16770 [Chryseobacterium sp. HR92]